MLFYSYFKKPFPREPDNKRTGGNMSEILKTCITRDNIHCIIRDAPESKEDQEKMSEYLRALMQVIPDLR